MAEEEDYMGDLSRFLTPEPAVKSKAKPAAPLPQSSDAKRKFPKGISWQEKRRLLKERKQQEEDDKTLERISECPIPQSNIGFQLLKRMGYNPEANEKAGPVGIEIRRTRVGIGREDPARERKRREAEESEIKRRKTEEMAEEFGDLQRSRWKGRRVAINYAKAKAALDQLENREVESVVDQSEEDENQDEEEEEPITEEGLLELLVKLRDEHQYCLFCGLQYESHEALLSDCPGINEDDH